MYHIIFNPQAQSGKSKRYLDRVIEILTAEGKEFTVHATEYKGHAEELVRALGEEVETVIAVGGDGTIHEVLNGLCAPEKTNVAFIPAGTGNDFCGAAGVTDDVEEIMERVLRGTPQATDYMEAGGRRCMNVCGMGMDVDVLERCAKGKMTGKIKYYISLLQSVLFYRGCKLKLTVDGQVYERNALFAAVCNGQQFGGGMRICPTADIADGKLEVVTVEKMSLLQLIPAFIKLMKGEILSHPKAEHFYCTKAELTPIEPSSAQLDGEIYYGYENFGVEIKQGLKIYR